MNELVHLEDSLSGKELFVSLVKSLSPRWPDLPDKPEETPTVAIRALWQTAAGKRGSVQRAFDGELPALNPDARARLAQLLEQRLAGVPLAHLTGWQNFMGLELKAGPQALIPRKETEILGHTALKLLRTMVRDRGQARVMDICTGSGNLALALAAHEFASQIFAADLCADAVTLARENSELHQLHDRVDFRVGDLFAPFAGGEFDAAMDLIVCNPPYLSTSKVGALPREIGAFEPREAFDAGSFGLGIVTRLANEAPRFLKPGSWLCFEVGAGQGDFLVTRLERLGVYQKIQTAVDPSGEVRALMACV